MLFRAMYHLPWSARVGSDTFIVRVEEYIGKRDEEGNDHKHQDSTDLNVYLAFLKLFPSSSRLNGTFGSRIRKNFLKIGYCNDWKEVLLIFTVTTVTYKSMNDSYHVTIHYLDFCTSQFLSCMSLRYRHLIYSRKSTISYTSGSRASFVKCSKIFSIRTSRG